MDSEVRLRAGIERLERRIEGLKNNDGEIEARKYLDNSRNLLARGETPGAHAYLTISELWVDFAENGYPNRQTLEREMANLLAPSPNNG